MMFGGQNESSSEATSVPTDDPAIGLVANGGNTDWIAASIVDARRHGLPTLVTGPPGGEWRVYADILDATVVEIDEDVREPRPPRNRLAAAARERGLPGVVIHDDVGGQIDFAESRRALVDADEYVVDAVTEPPVEDAHIVAGIPAYNEASTIGEVVDRVAPHVDEVVVVDDGSGDETALEAAEAGATVVEHRRNRGYGAALKTLFQQVDRGGADHLVVLDADSQHDPDDVPALVERQRSSGAEIVVGSRFVADGATDAPMYRRLGLFVVNSLTNVSHGSFHPRSWVRDTQSGFRAYSREVIASLASDDTIGDRMSASTDILHHAARRGYTVEEVGTTVSYDVEEANTRHPLTHGLSLVQNIVQRVERRRPFSVLGIPGFTSWLVGLGAGYFAVTTYLTTGTLPVSVGVLAAVLTLAGLLACVAAVVLHTLSVHYE